MWLAALGVVFGDIGTSPLYTFKTVIALAGGDPSPRVVLGSLSLILWTLTIITTIKYVSVAMRIDNDGEGGILALMSLLGVKRQKRPMLIAIGLFGAALLYGDGAITPAISVLSALEGLELAMPVLKPYVLPMAVAILAALFFVQPLGTHRIGQAFGPIMLAWFAVIALLGLVAVIQHPGVLAAIMALVASSGWRVRRIQHRRAMSADYRREIVASLRSSIVFSLIGVGVFVAQRNGIFPARVATGGPAILSYIVAMLVAHDAYFYWTHRAMHHPRLFGWMHRLHHRSVTPTPFAAYSFSISEAVVQALFVVLWVGAIATPFQATMIFMLIQILRNAWGHCGFELHPAGMVDHPVFGRLTTTLHHDLHHSGDFAHNYGLWFTWWDRWMGTEHPDYRSTFREITERTSGNLTAPSAAE